eukprot:m.124400 g.124400  ORF g.124400 m.124400 type:complete len:395 (-) comp13499_c0_seq4:2793-3977(-)
MGATGEVSQTTAVAAVCAAAAFKAVEVGVDFAHTATAGGVALGRTLTAQTAEVADQLFESYGVPNGEVVRLAFGDDAGQALIFIKCIAIEIGGIPPPGMTITDTLRAATALNSLQQTAGVADLRGTGHPDRMAAVKWGDIRRYLRFSLAMYGHLALKFLRLIPIAGAAVENDLAVVRSVTGGATVLRSEWAGSTYRPGYLLLLDEPGQAVVLSFRGTLRIHDVLTDLVCKQEPLQIGDTIGAAHGGMLKAAQRLLDELRADIEAALSSNIGFKLVLCGHSLGGGLATLMAVLIGPTIQVQPSEPENTAHHVPVTCFAYASPAVLSLELAAEATHVTSVVRLVFSSLAHHSHHLTRHPGAGTWSRYGPALRNVLYNGFARVACCHPQLARSRRRG